jgi:hypothetical protein
MRAFLAYDPAGTLGRLDVPVLALLAELDVQVLADQNEMPLTDVLGASASPHWEVRVLPGLNHLFQEAATGAVGEYAVIEQTIDPLVLDVITEWILGRAG